MKSQAISLFFVFAILSCSKTAEPEDFGFGWIYWSDNQPEKVAVTLPHDAMIGQARRADAPSGYGSAYFPSDVYHYEKTLRVPASWLDKHVALLFEGVYRNATVFVNGQEAAFHAYGFTPFTVSLDGLLHPGENTVRVDADNSAMPNLRWYSGGGIYRPVWLQVQEKEHIEDVQIRTLSIHPARIEVRTAHNGGKVSVDILWKGRSVTRAEGDAVELEIPDAHLWSADVPDLYQAVVTLKNDERKDVRTVDFGIRTLHYDTSGFYVNGENVLLSGACIHHDNGIIGAMEHDDAAFRRVRRLKEYGFNAIRSAHNPISPSLLRACDKLGMYVMDELYDGWFDVKNEKDYHLDILDNWQEDLSAMIRQDYNHPSVIMYSIGNELTEPAKAEGMELGGKMVDLAHKLDQSRPVTCGVNLSILADAVKKQAAVSAGVAFDDVAQRAAFMALLAKPMTSEEFNLRAALFGNTADDSLLGDELDRAVSPFLDLLDMAGYNYGEPRYRMEGRLHPDRMIVGTETSPANMFRNWQLVKELPYVFGDFMWTGWDYLGETGAGAWRYGTSALFAQPYPWLTGDFGAIDILGNPGGEAFLAKTVFSEVPDEPYIGVHPFKEGKPMKSSWRLTDAIPSWSWHGCEGLDAWVEVYSNAPEVELFQDGVSLGRMNPVENMAAWHTSYAPGKMEAVAYYNGSHTHTILQSAAGPLHLMLTPEKSRYEVGNLIYVNIDLVGENGITEVNADRVLTARVTGGELLGFGSALSTPDGYSFKDGRYPTHYGKAQAVIRTLRKGTVELTVNGEGLQEQSLFIRVK